jgi:heme-degrading monooxygenase HmoA
MQYLYPTIHLCVFGAGVNVSATNARRPQDDYLEYAARLRSELEDMDEFISVERFQSLTDPDKLLSLSFWRDEKAVTGWRSRAGHRATQSAGRKRVFRDYRLRVAAVVRDCGMSVRREQAPADSRVIYDV